MPKFNYTSKDKTGRTVKGEIDANSKEHALEILRGKELMILKLEEVKSRGSLFSSSKGKKKAKVKSEELVVFSRQLATMIDSGIPVVSALDILGEQLENPGFSGVIIDVRDAVNTGSSLSDALAKHSKVFPTLFTSMVRAGESSGTLDVVLERVSTYLEKSNSLQKKVKSALIYPSVVTFMALAITLVMILKVGPVFKDIFAGFSAALPAPTMFLINLSDAMRSYFLVFAIVFFAIGAAGKWYFGTPKGMFLKDSVSLKLPIFGPMLVKVAISKFTRTLGTLIKSGVPIILALEIVAETSGNLAIEQAIDKVKEGVKEGENIASMLEKSGLFPPMVTRMVSVGERSGELEKMLTKIADFFDDQVDTAVSGLTSLIEPLIIAFLGVIIGGIVLCMFLPIFKLSTVVNF